MALPPLTRRGVLVALGGAVGITTTGAIAEMAAAKNTTKEAIALGWLLRHPAGIQPILGTHKAERIAAAADRVAAGELDEQFPIDVFQTGSGTSSDTSSGAGFGAGSDAPRLRCGKAARAQAH